MTTYYDILELDNKCKQPEITPAYIKVYKNIKSNKSSRTIEELNEAFDTLKNPLTRYKYDQALLVKKYDKPLIKPLRDGKRISIMDSSNDTSFQMEEKHVEKYFPKQSNIDEIFKEKLMPVSMDEENYEKFTPATQEMTDKFNKINAQIADDTEKQIKRKTIEEVMKERDELVATTFNNKPEEIDFTKVVITNPSFGSALNDINENTRAYTMMDDIDNVIGELGEESEELKKLNECMEKAREKKDIDEYIKLRDEQKKLITFNQTNYQNMSRDATASLSK